MPRIVSGIAGGLRLDAPEGSLTRPTSDRVKEALFSIIAAQLPGARVLDLFAGSGGLGIEAVSRGAVLGDLVDSDRRSIACMRTNIKKSGLQGLRVLGGDVYRVLDTLAREGSCYELIFMDPPYHMATLAMERIFPVLGSGLLAPDGLVVLEHDAKDTAPAFVTNLKLVRNCKYGIAML